MCSVSLTRIKASLIELNAGMKSADTPRMLRSMEELDGLLASHRAELDGRLVHFLERRSYAKALDYVGGASDIPAGTCAPKPAAD